MKLQKETFQPMLEQLSEERRTVAESLIKNLIFMQNTLNELQKCVEEDGAIVEQVGGNGFVTRQEHPALKSYNTTIKNFNSTCKGLATFFEDAGTANDDELMQFLKGRNKAAKM